MSCVRQRTPAWGILRFWAHHFSIHCLKQSTTGRLAKHARRPVACCLWDRVRKAFHRNAQPQKELLRSTGVWGVHQQVSSGKMDSQTNCLLEHLVPASPACWYNVIDEIKIVSSQTVIWLCRFPKHSNIEILTGAESGKIACLVSIQELLTM